jgi:hypothetical protein
VDITRYVSSHTSVLVFLEMRRCRDGATGDPCEKDTDCGELSDHCDGGNELFQILGVCADLRCDVSDRILLYESYDCSQVSLVHF